MKKYKFFWSGPFSNWHSSYFTVDNIEYNCGEQYMMHVKALCFNDKVSARKIMNTDNPKQQKALGRDVKNFNETKWVSVRYDLVKKGLREKFSQNEDLKKYLLSFKDYLIVEASPYDRIWGIGFLEKDALSNIDKWGENLLGKILVELANEIV